jgi:hypothetical protein
MKIEMKDNEYIVFGNNVLIKYTEDDIETWQIDKDGHLIEDSYESQKNSGAKALPYLKSPYKISPAPWKYEFDKERQLYSIKDSNNNVVAGVNKRMSDGRLIDGNADVRMIVKAPEMKATMIKAKKALIKYNKLMNNSNKIDPEELKKVVKLAGETINKIKDIITEMDEKN